MHLKNCPQDSISPEGSPVSTIQDEVKTGRVRERRQQSGPKALDESGSGDILVAVLILACKATLPSIPERWERGGTTGRRELPLRAGLNGDRNVAAPCKPHARRLEQPGMILTSTIFWITPGRVEHGTKR